MVRSDGTDDGDTPGLFTVREMAALLRVCTTTVYAMVRRGELPHVRVSNAIRVVVGSAQDGSRR